MTKKLLVVGVLVGLVFACGGEENAVKSGKPLAKVEIDGKKLYTKNCVLCHGIYGNMGASGAYDLTKSELSMEEKIAVVTHGRKAMAAYKGVLSAAQIKAVVEYTETLKK
ncbi:MAG: cytochrome c [Bacteroidota bacterium]